MTHKLGKELKGKIPDGATVLVIGSDVLKAFKKALNRRVKIIFKSRVFFSIKKPEDYINNKVIKNFVSQKKVDVVVIGVYSDDLVVLFLRQFFEDKSLSLAGYVNLFASLKNGSDAGVLKKEINQMESQHKGTKNSLLASSKAINAIDMLANIL